MASKAPAMIEAVRSGDADAVRELLAEDPSLAAIRNEQGLSMLLQACYLRRLDLVELLLSAGPSLDIFEASALPGTHDRAVELLDADPQSVATWSCDGFSPLHLAAYFGRDDIARLLLERGADTNAQARNAMALRPLHSAAAGRALNIVRALLERGAEVNVQQHGGWTALHAAAANGDFPMTELLLARGASPGLLSDDKRTALDLATEKGHTEVVALLRGRDAV
jgi:uncharacterized protein